MPTKAPGSATVSKRASGDGKARVGLHGICTSTTPLIFQPAESMRRSARDVAAGTLEPLNGWTPTAYPAASHLQRRCAVAAARQRLDSQAQPRVRQLATEQKAHSEEDVAGDAQLLGHVQVTIYRRVADDGLRQEGLSMACTRCGI